MRLDGKVALVTGASRGIGRAIAVRLGRDGAAVVVNYSGNQKAARETVAAVEAASGRAVAVQGDVGRSATYNGSSTPSSSISASSTSSSTTQASCSTSRLRMLPKRSTTGSSP